MQNSYKKTSSALIFIGVFFFFSLHPANAQAIKDGDLIKTPDSPDVYIVKIVEESSANITKFKRLILNPAIFDSYGHLNWSDIKETSQEVLDTFTDSDLVIEVNADGSVANPKIYRTSSAPESDTGERYWLNLTAAEFEYMGFDWRALYHINHIEASPDFYSEGEAIAYDKSVYSREHFTVYLNDTKESILEKLKLEGFIADTGVFSNKLGTVAPGGYYLSAEMGEDEIASILSNEPFMVWVTIPEGYRKEQIGDLLASRLNWTAVQRASWGTAYQKLDYKTYENAEDYKEGVYFPDTYLFPRTEGPIQAATRMVNNFNKRFAGYVEAFSAEHNIGWQDALTLASIVQREASGFEDAGLVAGILWNRVAQDMAFQVDVTIQYAVNTKEGGWWAPIKSSDRKVDSLFNTYLYKGVTPHPIANPGMVAIDAVLSPQKTDCIFFIHAKGQIYCSATYQGHLNN
ncbi:MAG: endolytic transglycosylase MltG, partial [Candidatus Spechtbacterales bacterium]